MSKKVSAPKSPETLVDPELEVKAEGAPEVILDNDEVKAPVVDGAEGAPEVEPEIEPEGEPEVSPEPEHKTSYTIAERAELGGISQFFPTHEE